MESAKHIGIASVTAEGGALAYREIVHASELLLGRNIHPEISLHSHSFSKYIDSDPQNGIWDQLIIESSQKLASAGAEFFICPSNTNHVVYDRVQAALAIPWLHIASTVAERAFDLRCKRALLLGTKTLMNSSVYSPFLSFREIELRIPNNTEQEELNRLIYEELVAGRVITSSKVFVESLISKYIKAEQADSVILGCTELPMLIKKSDMGVTILDSTRLVAHGAIAYSLGLSLFEVERLISDGE